MPGLFNGYEPIALLPLLCKEFLDPEARLWNTMIVDKALQEMVMLAAAL